MPVWIKPFARKSCSQKHAVLTDTLLVLQNNSRGSSAPSQAIFRGLWVSTGELIKLQTNIPVAVQQHFPCQRFPIFPCQSTGSMRTTTASPAWLLTPSAAIPGAWTRPGSWTTASTRCPSNRRSLSCAASRGAASTRTAWRRKWSPWAARVSPHWSSTRPKGSPQHESGELRENCLA